jgi:hypothetical protein
MSSEPDWSATRAPRAGRHSLFDAETAMTDPMINRIGCLASVRAWRREASLIRELADRSHLPALRRQSLLREADAADQQADSWLDAAMTTGDHANK